MLFTYSASTFSYQCLIVMMFSILSNAPSRPKISLWFGPHNIERANSITLPVCHVEGFPLPSITWTKVQADIMPAKAVVKGKQLKNNKYQEERFGFVVQMSSLKQLRK